MAVSRHKKVKGMNEDNKAIELCKKNDTFSRRPLAFHVIGTITCGASVFHLEWPFPKYWGDVPSIFNILSSLLWR